MSTRTSRLDQPLNRIDVARTALLVIDMQRYFVDPESAFGRFVSGVNAEGAGYYFRRVDELVVPNTRRLLEAFRERGGYVVYTEFGSAREDGRDMAGWARRMNGLGASAVGTPIYPNFADATCRVDDRLAPRPGELVVQKTTSGPLNSTRLDQTLRVLGIDSVVVTGVVTDVCVAQTTREFGDRDFDAVVVSDACATFDDTTQDVTLDTLAIFGYVASTNELLQRI